MYVIPPPTRVKLFTYSPEKGPRKSLAAFRSGGSSSGVAHAVFVPGLLDGLLTLGYVPALAAAMNRLGFSFVQPILSSAYKGKKSAVPCCTLCYYVC